MPEAKSFVFENSGLLSGGKVAIIGGAGGMGRLLAKGLKACGLEVAICDVDEKKGKDVAKRIGVSFLGSDSLQCFEVVIVAVPFEEMLKASLKSLSKMREGSLLVDVSSIKTGIVGPIKKNLPDWVEYVSMHPLFGPTVRDLKGKKIAVIPIKAERWLGKLLSILRGMGCETILSSIEEHEKAMAKIQALHHFSYLCLVDCLSKLGFDRKFSTESFERTLNLLNRLRSNLDAILSIQKHNPFAEGMRLKYMEAVEALSKAGSSDLERILREDFANFERWQCRAALRKARL